MKMSKAERKAFNQGKVSGYAEGYAAGYVKGYKEGNPFNALIEAITEAACNVSKIMEDPETRKALFEAMKDKEEDND